MKRPSGLLLGLLPPSLRAQARELSLLPPLGLVEGRLQSG